MGCAGFPVPATRYFKEFLFVEVQETAARQFAQGVSAAGLRKSIELYNNALDFARVEVEIAKLAPR